MALRGFRLALRGAERLNDATARRLIEALRLAERDSSFGIIEASGEMMLLGGWGVYPPGNDHISHLGKRKLIFKGFFLVGGNSNIFYFQPRSLGEDEPNLTVAYFSDGWEKTTNQVGFEKISPEVGFGDIS